MDAMRGRRGVLVITDGDVLYPEGRPPCDVLWLLPPGNRGPVHEFVTHFDRRGRLSCAQIRRLLEQGSLAADAPANMADLAQPVGATYYFRVTDDTHGPCWGTDVYTGDSSIAVAAVHMGLVKAGMSVIVRVEAVSPPTEFRGSARHGVTRQDFGRYGSAYRLAAV